MGPPYHVAKRAVWILGGTLNVGRREDPFFFFDLHPMFGGKLDVGAPEDDFGGGHALPSFGSVLTLCVALLHQLQD